MTEGLSRPGFTIIGTYLVEAKEFEGALWECDCGRAWHCSSDPTDFAPYWVAVPPRKARKILKRAARL